MGCDFRWVMCGLDANLYQSIQNDFQIVQQSASVSDEHKVIYELCRQSPKKILPKYVPKDELPPQFDRELFKNGYIDAELSNKFSSVFLVSGFDDFFHKLPLNEETVLRFISCDQSPVATLYYALGINIAEQLPGYLGNMLINRNDLENAIKQVDAVLEQLDDGSWDRARRYISRCSAGKPRFGHDEDISEIFSALPQALREARARQISFVSVAFWSG